MVEINDRQLNNKGFSLIELIVVIAIMAIMVGGMSLGVSLVFSKDAARCATRLNDAIYSTRMDAMSKAGAYTLTIKKNSNDLYVAEINDGNGNTQVVVLEGDSNAKKIKSITAVFPDDGSEGYPPEKTISNSKDLPIVLTFDKAKGNIRKITANGSDVSLDEGILCFYIEPKSGNRKSKVQLVVSTGKHTVGEFN